MMMMATYTDTTTYTLMTDTYHPSQKYYGRALEGRSLRVRERRDREGEGGSDEIDVTLTEMILMKRIERR